MTTPTAPRLTPAETAGVIGDVVAPLLARGVIVRRPPVETALDRLDADRRAVRRLQRVRDAHGPGPVRLTVPGREVAVVLAPQDVRRVLDESPEPFALATVEKRAALSHFQPDGVLVSHGAERADRRRFNEAVLESDRPVHDHAAAFTAKIGEEADALLRGPGPVTWDDFAVTWWRIVRRVVLGDAARDDHEVTDLLRRLRGDANWAYLKPKRKALRSAFFRRLGGHLARGEPGSLAELVRSVPATPDTDPDQQVPQWLFAFDAAGMAAFRALALLDAHPDAGDLGDPDFLRRTVLESVRLWPTTPAILRDTTTDTSWASGTLRAGTGLVIFVPFFHRDPAQLPEADRFAPGLWSGGARAPAALVPFSAGPGECPGRNLVLLTTSTLLQRLLERHRFRSGALDASRPLPATLSPFRLRFELVRR